jgi:hypothetical protein
MKRMLLVALALTMIFTMCSCGKSTEKSDLLSPKETVARWLYAEVIHDEEVYKSTLTDERRSAYEAGRAEYPSETEFGSSVVSLTVYEIRQYKGEAATRKANELINSPLGEKWGVTDTENVAYVKAHFNEELVETAQPLDDDDPEWGFVLIRENENSPWLIADWGYGSFPDDAEIVE